MSRPSYLPTGVLALDAWVKNFVSKLPQYAADFMIPEGEIKELENQMQMYSFVLQYISYLEEELSKQYRFKESFVEGEISETTFSFLSIPPPSPIPPAVSNGLVKRIARLVKRLKTMPLYNEIVGIDLQIISPKVNHKSAYTTKPQFKVSLDANRPVIKWKKNGVEAIDIFVDRSDGRGFQLLGSTTRAKFVDMHPLPSEVALWIYQVIHKKGSERVGDYSNPSSIAVVNRGMSG